MPLRSINPATSAVIAEYPEHGQEEIGQRIANAAATFQTWRRKPVAERAALLISLADTLRSGREQHARLMALEMGKPISQGLAEIDKCADTCDYYARNAERLLAPRGVTTEASASKITFEPLGVVLAIMPWNFPFWQVIRCAATALVAGNTVLLKHASNVTGCARALESVFKQSGFPSGAFSILQVSSSQMELIIAQPAIQAVTFTGSTPAGSAVAAVAGRHLKKTVLELGGSDAYIVLDDAELPLAAEVCALSRLINSGQSCVAAKRFIVVEQAHTEFTRLFIDAMKKAKPGDPLDSTTTLGPLARLDLRDQLQLQVDRTIEQGAKLLLGGCIPAGPGAYYPPTVLDGVRLGMTAFDEETFGPVAAIVPVKDESEAIRLANTSPFGLGAAVFTRDIARGERIARMELEAGNVFVNTQVRSDPRLPFGGIKQSGYGRELAEFGLMEFSNIKTLYVK